MKIYHLNYNNKNLHLVYLPDQNLVMKYDIKINWIYNAKVDFRFDVLNIEMEPHQVVELYHANELFNGEVITAHKNANT